MSRIQEALGNRFGEHRVMHVPVEEGQIPLLALDLELRSPTTILVTNGLSDYKMPVPEKYAGREYNELYFCLPNYWEWENLEDPKFNWVFHWIQRMAKFVQENETWFGPGHTMPAGKEMKPLSPTMQQNHFMLMEPMLCEQELASITIDGREIHFLAIVPIFKEELDYKQNKGTFKLLQKFSQTNNSELLDDFRTSVVRSKWRFRR